MCPFRDITAVVLAGGLGSRLRPVVPDRSKVVAMVGGRPFLHYLLDQLVSSGIRKVVLCTGYLSENVREIIGDSYRTLKLEYSAETEPLGTGGALRMALPLLTSDPVLVMNGDSYCDIDIQSFLYAHIKYDALVTLALNKVHDISRFGAVDINTDNMITYFEEKGGRQGGGLISTGIYLFSRNIILNISCKKMISLERDIFPGLIGNGLSGFVCSGKFIDIGIPEDYYAAASFFDNTTDKELL